MEYLEISSVTAVDKYHNLKSNHSCSGINKLPLATYAQQTFQFVLAKYIIIKYILHIMGKNHMQQP
jgi:hypothetical protein